MLRRHLSATDVARIVTLLQQGYSQVEVAASMGVSQSVVSRAYARFNTTQSYDRRPGQGRQRITTERDDRAIIREARRNPTAHALTIAHQFRNRRQRPPQQHISASTVRNRFREQGLRARRAKRVPMLTPRHRRARLAYAHDHHHWGRRQWTSVLFTDESRFCLHGSDRRSLVWRRRGERDRDGFTQPVTAFNGGSVMVWAGVSFNTRTPLVIVRGTLTADRYVNENLQPHVLPMRARIGARRFILMQDNARPHTAVRTRTFLRDNNVTTLNHPAMSPDLNPIEHVWDMLGRRLRRDYPQLHNLQQLTQALLRCWQGISQRDIRRCINMQDRLRAVIRNRGGNTRY